MSSLKRVFNLFVTTCDFLASVAEVRAWVVSCKIVCALIPVVAFILTVLVSGSNKPAAETPALLVRFSTTSTFVSPNFCSYFLAIWDTRLLGDVAARTRSASFNLPARNKLFTSGCVGKSSPTTWSICRSFSSRASFALFNDCCILKSCSSLSAFAVAVSSSIWVSTASIFCILRSFSAITPSIILPERDVRLKSMFLCLIIRRSSFAIQACVVGDRLALAQASALPACIPPVWPYIGFSTAVSSFVRPEEVNTGVL